MDQYIILISDTLLEFKENSFTHSNLKECSLSQSSAFQERKSSVFICNLFIESLAFSADKNVNFLEWKNVQPGLVYKPTKILSCIHASELIFSLTDNLPFPGSFLLNVHWYISDSMLTSHKQLFPLLGCLKKLHLWQNAKIYLFTKPESSFSPTLNNISKFVSANIVNYVNVAETWQMINRSTIWKGGLNLGFSKTFSATQSKFELLQHNCHRCFCSSPSLCGFHKTESDNYLWFENNIDVIDLINPSTVPLFYFSGSILLLKCMKNESIGIKLKHILKSAKDSALFCRLKFLCTEKKWPSCEILSSLKWKERIKCDPSSLNPPSIVLPEKSKFVYFIVTDVSKDICENFIPSSNSIYFHAYTLHPSFKLNLNMLIDEELQSTYTFPKSALDLDSNHLTMRTYSNAYRFQFFDKIYGKLFTHTLLDWIQKKSCVIDKQDLQGLIAGCWSILEEKFHLHASQDFEISSSLLNSEAFIESKKFFPEMKILCLHGNDNSNAQVSNTTNVAPLLLSGLFKSKLVDFRSDSILSKFTNVDYQNYWKDIKQAQRKKDKPSLDCLKNFHSALVTTYHGINFNIDAQGSEIRDSQNRKLVNQLVKFETLSTGSTIQVMSLNSARFNDSPLKAKKGIHTPRKKKRLAKVAEKLFKKRNSFSTTNKKCQSFFRSPSKALLHKAIHGKTSAFQTPTKVNSSESKHSLISPSSHKMKLRSSTPSKQSGSSPKKTTKLTPKSKVALKRKLQKQYVLDNKKRLQDIVVNVLSSKNIKKDHPAFDKHAKKLYRVSMAFLKDLKTSKDLETKMFKIVNENARLVLSLEMK